MAETIKDLEAAIAATRESHKAARLLCEELDGIHASLYRRLHEARCLHDQSLPTVTIHTRASASHKHVIDRRTGATVYTRAIGSQAGEKGDREEEGGRHEGNGGS